MIRVTCRAKAPLPISQILPRAKQKSYQVHCMINARIFDGDIVFIREQPEVENGEIAAVLIDDEATLKHVYKQNSA